MQCIIIIVYTVHCTLVKVQKFPVTLTMCDSDMTLLKASAWQVIKLLILCPCTSRMRQLWHKVLQCGKTALDTGGMVEHATKNVAVLQKALDTAKENFGSEDNSLPCASDDVLGQLQELGKLRLKTLAKDLESIPDYQEAMDVSKKISSLLTSFTEELLSKKGTRTLVETGEWIETLWSGASDSVNMVATDHCKRILRSFHTS